VATLGPGAPGAGAHHGAGPRGRQAAQHTPPGARGAPVPRRSHRYSTDAYDHVVLLVPLGLSLR
ncbi:hypothetical protein ABZ313_09885, partial [Streptomyces sp. NPDC006251]